MNIGFMTVRELMIGNCPVETEKVPNLIAAQSPGSATVIRGASGAGKSVFTAWLGRELGRFGFRVEMIGPTIGGLRRTSHLNEKADFVIFDGGDFQLGNPDLKAFSQIQPCRLVMTSNTDFSEKGAAGKLPVTKIEIQQAGLEEAQSIWKRFTAGRLPGQLDSKVMELMVWVSEGNRLAISTAAMALGCGMTRNPIEAAAYGLQAAGRNWWNKAMQMASPLQLILIEEIARSERKQIQNSVKELASLVGTSQQSIAKEAARLKKDCLLINDRRAKGNPYRLRSRLPGLIWVDEKSIETWLDN